MAETTNDVTTPTIAADADTSGAAGIAAATEFTPAGAPIQAADIDTSHPAVDANPRANTTVEMNRIDFNDPRPTDVIAAEAVEKAAAEKPKA